jgi:hypothetical protein
MGKLNSGGNAAATNSDIAGILGPIDSDNLEILSLHPTIAEVEEAAMWLSGDSEALDFEGWRREWDSNLRYARLAPCR